jgi:anti-sigma factor RsiW
MACDAWADRVALFVDGELPESDERDFEQHVRECGACASIVLRATQYKKMVQVAARQFTPRPEFRATIYRNITAARLKGVSGWHTWRYVSGAALALILIAAGFLFVFSRRSAQQQVLTELADLHVATLASANPVDVVSTDRHTVKPWFEGRIPFTFNLPEFAGTGYSLIGGKVTYLRQSPGAELSLQLRQHRLSWFIFQERALGGARNDCTLLSGSALNVCSWNQNGLEYFLIGDVNRDELSRLRDLIASAH